MAQCRQFFGQASYHVGNAALFRKRNRLCRDNENLQTRIICHVTLPDKIISYRTEASSVRYNTYTPGGVKRYRLNAERTSCVMSKVLAVILAGGQGERLSLLSQKRAKPAVPFAGKYRIIDFALSNCVNSGISDVAVLTQYRPHSLHDHIGIGRPWDLDRQKGGIRLLQPYIGRPESEWYLGTADAVYQNLDSIMEERYDYIVILAGDHIYRMDYAPMIAFHQQRNADVTLGAVVIPIEEGPRFGILETDAEGRVNSFEEKPAQPRGTLGSMGIYVFSRDTLTRVLIEDAHSDENNGVPSQHDFGRNIIPSMLARKERVYAYPFTGYWQDVGTIQSYWEAHMELLSDHPPFDLYDSSWVIHTRSEERDR